MCFKTPKAPAVTPTPQRADVQGEVTATRKKTAEQSGIFSNILTSPLGDSDYGKNAQKLAKLGAMA